MILALYIVLFGSPNDNEKDLFCIYNCLSNSWLWESGFRPTFIVQIIHFGFNAKEENVLKCAKNLNLKFLSVQVEIT